MGDDSYRLIKKHPDGYTYVTGFDSLEYDRY